MEQQHRRICDTFPDDIMLKILSQLPVKSLLRFKCVSKSWYNLITDPYFVKLHLHQSVQDENLGILLSFFPGLYPMNPTNPDQFVYYSTNLDNDDNNDDDDDEATTTEAASYSSSTSKLYNCMSWNESSFSSDDDHQGAPLNYIISASCNGLSLRSSFNGAQIALWNPSTRDFKELPPPVIHHNNDDRNQKFHLWEMFHGLGYDSKNDDYKVLLITCFISLSPQLYDHKTDVTVYSLQSNTWRRPRSKHIVDYRFYDNMGRYLNGAVHYLSYNSNGSSSSSSSHYREMRIVCFDCVTEDWKEFELPHDLLDYQIGNNIILCLMVSQGRLHIVCGWHKLRTEVYVMNEYGVKESWCKLTTTLHKQLFDRFSQHNMWNIGWIVLAVIKNDKFLLWGCNDNNNEGKLILYNRMNCSVEEIKIHVSTVCKKLNISYADTYISSLVALKPPRLY